MLRPYRNILSHPGALGFSSAGVLARLPISMVTIAIVLLLSAVYDQYAIAGGVAAVYTVAQAVFAPQLARLVDRHGQARIMRPALAIALVGLVTLAYLAAIEAAPVWLFLTGGLAGATVGSIPAMVRARWNEIVTDPQELHTAYSLESALDELVFALGPVAATFLATELSPVIGLYVGIAVAGFGGFWFLGQRGTEPPAAGAAAGSPGRSLIRSGSIVLISAVFICLGVVFGASDVATVGYTEELGMKSWAGIALGALATGSLLSGLLYGTRAFVMVVWKRFILSICGLALGATMLLFAHHLAVLCAVLFVTGFAIAPTVIAGSSLVQELVPRRQLTEGLTWVSTAIGVGVALGSSISGQIIDRVGAHAGYLAVIGATVVATIIVLTGAPVLRRHYLQAQASS